MAKKSVSPNQLSVRPPVVVIMGHIDHGKSTLLDCIRQANVTATEAGGITQAVSAYEATVQGADGEAKITFIDTPGHEAFSGMRAHGAAIADLAILIVAADDGVKPQTREALKVIREAKLPFIVAINKTDKAGANPERVKQELAEAEVLVEGYGGSVPVATLSAKTGEGVPELLELIVLAAEMEELTTDASRPASGFVLESKRSPQTGVLTTLVIKDGTLQAGDWLVAGNEMARVKRLNDFLGRSQPTLAASAPAQASGFEGLPEAGTPFVVVADKKAAEAGRRSRPGAAPLASAPTTEGVEIPLVVKSAVAGSLDAVRREILKTATPAVGLRVVAEGVGQITENDVKLAAGSRHSVILGFGVTADRQALAAAEKLGLTIQTFDIIYHLSEWLSTEVARRTPRVETEETLGRAKVLKIFSLDRSKQVIGGVVSEGRLLVGKAVRISRRETELARGKILELRQQKIIVKEVPENTQFGALLEAKIALAPGDVIECFELTVK